MKIIGISGSIRTGSLNTRLLHAAAELTPVGVTLDIISIADIPLYNGDIDGEVKPDSVERLKNRIKESDGVIFATPEYNYSISGVLKNAIDWASRPGYKSVLAKKPAAILSAAKGPVGGGRAQSHLRDIFSATLTPVVPSPPYLLPKAPAMFNEEGRLVDEDALRRLERYVQEFAQWVELLKGL